MRAICGGIAWSFMARLRRDEERVYSEREIKLANMRNGRIEKKYLLKLVIDYKFKKKIDPNYSMPRELAEVVLIIIDKMLGSSSWRSYSEDWREEFRARAIEHVIKYAHNFDPVKSKSGKNDPYNYFAMIIGNAFIQSWRKCKVSTENAVQYNNDFLYNHNNWSDDQNVDINIQARIPDIDALDWGHFNK